MYTWYQLHWSYFAQPGIKAHYCMCWLNLQSTCESWSRRLFSYTALSCQIDKTRPNCFLQPSSPSLNRKKHTVKPTVMCSSFGDWIDAIWPNCNLCWSHLNSFKENWPVDVFESIDNDRGKVLCKFRPFFLAILDHIIGQVKEGQLAWHLSCKHSNTHLNILLWSTSLWFANHNF